MSRPILYFTNTGGDASWQTLANWNTAADGSGDTPTDIPWSGSTGNLYGDWDLADASGGIVFNNSIIGGANTVGSCNLFVVNYGTINGGTFTNSFECDGGTVYGGTFTGNNCTTYDQAHIYGGTFTGTGFNLYQGSALLGGTFEIYGLNVDNSQSINSINYSNISITNNGIPYTGIWRNNIWNNGAWVSPVKILYFTNSSLDGNWDTLANWNTFSDGTGDAPTHVPWTDNNLGGAWYGDYDLVNGDGLGLYSSTNIPYNVTISSYATGNCSVGTNCQGYITNTGTINGGTWSGAGWGCCSGAGNSGIINGGIFTTAIQNWYGGIINGGTFEIDGFWDSNNGYDPISNTDISPNITLTFDSLLYTGTFNNHYYSNGSYVDVSTLYYTNSTGNKLWSDLRNWNTASDGTGIHPTEIPWTLINGYTNATNLVDATSGVEIHATGINIAYDNNNVVTITGICSIPHVVLDGDEIDSGTFSGSVSSNCYVFGGVYKGGFYSYGAITHIDGLDVDHPFVNYNFNYLFDYSVIHTIQNDLPYTGGWQGLYWDNGNYVGPADCAGNLITTPYTDPNHITCDISSVDSFYFCCGTCSDPDACDEEGSHFGELGGPCLYRSCDGVSCNSQTKNISGCTDSSACGYSSSATCDDGSCYWTCDNSGARNYHNQCGEACWYTDCNDSSACNFDQYSFGTSECSYPSDPNYDCYGNCIASTDCTGTCGGTCGNCDYNGTCCDGGTVGCDGACNSGQVNDCTGTCGGTCSGCDNYGTCCNTGIDREGYCCYQYAGDSCGNNCCVSDIINGDGGCTYCIGNTCEPDCTGNCGGNAVDVGCGCNVSTTNDYFGNSCCSSSLGTDFFGNSLCDGFTPSCTDTSNACGENTNGCLYYACNGHCTHHAPTLYPNCPQPTVNPTLLHAYRLGVLPIPQNNTAIRNRLIAEINNFPLILQVASIHGTVSFTTVGATTFTVPTGVTSLSALVIAGGGGGGTDGGGGGAGGLIFQTLSVTPNTVIDVFVGDGGTIDNNGQNTIFGSLTAIGGGAGGARGYSGYNGGSGGGGASIDQAVTGGTNFPNQGHNGGTASADGSQGGGGGSHGAGVPGTSSSHTGSGGIGTLINITGTPTRYAGGGGRIGGLGGGGSDGQDGTPNTGGGGGFGANGGSGIVIIKY